MPIFIASDFTGIGMASLLSTIWIVSVGLSVVGLVLRFWIRFRAAAKMCAIMGLITILPFFLFLFSAMLDRNGPHDVESDGDNILIAALLILPVALPVAVLFFLRRRQRAG